MSFWSWLSFTSGRFELCFAVLFGFIGLLVLWYSLARVRGGAGQLAEYYIFLVVLVTAGLGVVFARDLLLLFVFWELATVALWRLVSYFRREESVLAASLALYINFIAAAVMLVGLVLIQLEHGSWNLSELARRSLSFFPAILILVGILAKSATLPLYIWLPRAYREAPAPVCALLSGVAENLGVVLFLKLFIMTMKVPESFFLLSAWLAVVSSLVASGVALTTKTIRETLAYSTVGQLGFILLGFAVAGYYGIMGGLLYVMAHAVAKAGLFFTAGVVEDLSGTGELTKLGGFARRSPVLAGAAGVLVLSIMGLPPTLGFFAKVSVVIVAVQRDILFGIGAIVAALFTVLYLSRFYARIFLGAEQGQGRMPVSGIVITLVVVMAVVTVVAGVCWFVPVRFLEAEGMMTSWGW